MAEEWSQGVVRNHSPSIHCSAKGCSGFPSSLRDATPFSRSPGTLFPANVRCRPAARPAPSRAGIRLAKAVEGHRTPKPGGYSPAPTRAAASRTAPALPSTRRAIAPLRRNGGWRFCRAKQMPRPQHKDADSCFSTEQPAHRKSSRYSSAA